MDQAELTMTGPCAAHVDHAVQFYEQHSFLADIVVEYVADGIDRGQPALLIVTPEHRDAIAAGFAARGTDVSALIRGGTLTLADARETIAAFMGEGGLDAARFREVIGSLVQEARGASRSVRAFGEMVDLLWRAGDAAAVMQVEALWNELMAGEGVELLCAYDMGGFADASHAAAFAEICRAHHHVLPTESYTRASDATRLVEISSLQQRARSLETELRQRALLEQRLREALEQRERVLDEERAMRAEAERARLIAQEANRAKSTFLAVMSHELRTPLNAIGGYAELIAMEVFGPVPAAQREALGRLQQSQRHLLGLIDQVLGYVDAESGATRYEIATFRLGDVLDSVDQIMGPRLREAGIAYGRSPAGNDLAVRADPTKTRQILLHLVSNAVKFTEPGGRIEVGALASAGCVLVRVRDTGIGIPGRDLTTIFEPFLQREAALTRTRGGMGLGLTLSRELAVGMHGDLTVESAEGQGSTFTLRLPQAR